MINLPQKLKSRKFWLALCAAVTFFVAGQYDNALFIVLTFLGVEGGADALSRFQEGKKQVLEKLELYDGDDSVDRSVLVSGKE